MRPAVSLVCCLLGGLTGCAPGPAERSVGNAVAHLAREVPRWPRENACFSCHHSGDGARALLLARQSGFDVPREALQETLEWLLRPESWDEQHGDPSFSDKKLARLQFSAALGSAVAARAGADNVSIEAAGAGVERLQDASGAWAVEAADSPGSPVTWGSYLATSLMCRTLEALDARRFAESIRRGRAWLQAAPVRNVHEAAAVLIGLGRPAEVGAGTSRTGECLALLRRGRTPEGGWGPYVTSPAEVFDTALVLLALGIAPETEETRLWIREGRQFLVQTQLEDGSWPATTRPAGGESHAQATSTSAWATLALLQTAQH